MPGPRPVPAEILRRRGSWRAKKAAENAPIVTDGAPKRPAWLSKNARAVWRQVVPELEAMGVLASIDGQALSRYCHLVAVWRECADFCEQNGHFYVRAEDDAGVRRLRPEAKMMRELAQDLARTEADFGMNAAARSRVKIPAKSTYEAEKEAKIKKYFIDAG